MPGWFRTAALVGTLAVVAPLGGVAPAAQADDADDAAVSRPLAVTELDLGDATRQQPAATARSRAQTDEAAQVAVVDSGELSTDPFMVLGVSWSGSLPADTTVTFRTRTDDVWTDWVTADAADGPSSSGRVNSEAIAVAPADGLQLVVSAAAAEPQDVKVVLIDPGTDPVPAAGTTAEDQATTLAAGPSFARPAIISRAAWGADESLRTCTPDYTTSTVSAAVHHTDSVNSYTPDQAAGIVRGILAYHTRPEAAGGRGWCDIGYNALVDRFGRIYEGRAGSFDESVVGVHTGGFNTRTFGVSVIGNFVSTVPGPEIIEGVSQAIAWKFATERIFANTSVSMVSGGGASKYPEGAVVTFPTIYAHRDAQLTSCPGEQLYARLQQIRDRVAALSNDAVNASPFASWDATSTTATSLRVQGWAIDPETSDSLVVDAVVDRVSHPVSANINRPDVGAGFPGAGSAHGFDVTVPLPPGPHVVCLWVRNVGAGNDQLLGCRQVSVVNRDPVGFVDQVSVTPSSVIVQGWTLDPDSSASLGVHIYVNGAFATAITADRPRTDIGAAYPGKGDAHGFSVEQPVAAGTLRVCAYAINVPDGRNPELGCRVVTVVNAAPVGFVDDVVATKSSVVVKGWALDSDTPSPLAVHVYVDGRHLATATAGASRPDIGAAFPGSGNAHGFSVEQPVAAGTHRVCAYAINVPTGANVGIGCRTVTVVNAEPKGSLDVVTGGAGAVTAQGWALDADTTGPIDVHVYVNGAFAGATSAATSRPDVGAAFPGMGSAHGFSATLPAARGTARVCVWAINAPAGVNPGLGCRDVTVS